MSNRVSLVGGFGVYSEIAPLRKVLIRRPGEELDLVTPNNYADVLFDDILFLPEAQKEHTRYMRFLKSQGIQVVEHNVLLEEVLSNDMTKGYFLETVFAGKKKVIDLLKKSSVSDVVDYLYKGKIQGLDLPELLPAVNGMFTRDAGAFAGSMFFAGAAKFPVRSREFLITQAILSYHPDFSESVSVYSPEIRDGHHIEAGDIQILSNNIVCIGISQRTSYQAAIEMAEKFHKEGFLNVIFVHLDKARSCMHLDTVFTMVSQEECVIYAPMIVGDDNTNPADVQLYKKDEEIKDVGNLIDTLFLLGLELKTIYCGGENRVYQDREQWTDGANCLTIRPGHVLVYKRNVRTLEEFEKSGYIHICANDVHVPLSVDHKYVISFDGGELSRARGGWHCLSCPIHRE